MALNQLLVSAIRETVVLVGYDEESPVIIWLWEILEEFNYDQRAKFNYFITGIHFMTFKINTYIL